MNMMKARKNLTLIPLPAMYILAIIVFGINMLESVPKFSAEINRGELPDVKWHFGQSIMIHTCLGDAPSMGLRMDLLKTYGNIPMKNFGLRTTNPSKKSTMLVLLLILGGDVESNPGPVRYPCKICQKPVAKNHRAVMCEWHACQQWVHIKCGNVTPEDYEELQNNKQMVWFCHSCDNLNLMTSLGSDSIPTDNSFSILSESDEDLFNEMPPDKEIKDKASNESTKKPASSQSKTKENKQKQNSSKKKQHKTKHRPKFRRLRLLSLNCRSLKSKKKQKDLRSVITQENPDIICGNESHLDGDYFTSEVFPDTHEIFRKDRNRYGGGVFIGVKKDLLAMQEHSLDTDNDCESIWIKIIFAGKQPLYIGSFYRPTNANPVPLTKLDEALKKLTTRSTLPNIILAGDFNTPDINWKDSTIITGENKPRYGKHLNQTMLDLANDNMLSQMQHLPTRGDSVLDLVFTTIPDQIIKTDTTPGMADHDAVTVQLDTTVKYGRKKPRIVYQYNKGDMDGLRKDLESFKDTFLQSNPKEKDINSNWESLKTEVFRTMKKNIPHKRISSWQHVPWMKITIKRLIRKKKRLWKKAKKTNKEEHWQEFKDTRKAVKHRMKKSYDDYVSGIFEKSEKGSHKQFWKFINNQKKRLRRNTNPQSWQ